jgi:hypothetical protein
VEDPDFGGDPPCAIQANLDLSISCKWAAQKPAVAWPQWVEFWQNQIPAGSEHDAADDRGLSRLTLDADPAETANLVHIWENLHNPDLVRVAKRLGDLACEAKNGSGIANRLVHSMLLSDPQFGPGEWPDVRDFGTEEHALAIRLADAHACPGALLLDDYE